MTDILWGSSRALLMSSQHSPPVHCNVLRALKFGAGALHDGSGSCQPQTQKIASVRQQQRETGKVLHWLVVQGLHQAWVGALCAASSTSLFCIFAGRGGHQSVCSARSRRSGCVIWGMVKIHTQLAPIWGSCVTRKTPLPQDSPHALRDMSQGDRKRGGEMKTE